MLLYICHLHVLSYSSGGLSFSSYYLHYFIQLNLSVEEKIEDFGDAVALGLVSMLRAVRAVQAAAAAA